jgi:cell division protein FtsN
MYCKNCQLEIKDQEGSECPLCGSTLVEPSVDETMHNTAVGIDFDAMQDDAAAFVLDNEDNEDMELESQTAGEMHSHSTDRAGMNAPGQADHAPAMRTPALIDDKTTEMLDQALEEYDPMVDEHFKVKKTGSKSSTTLLLLVLLVCVLGGAGYYFFMMNESAPPEPVAPVKIASPQKQDAVLDKVLRKEPAAPATAQQATVDNTTQEPLKHEALKSAQTAVKKADTQAVAEQPVPETKPAEPVEASRAPEKTLQSDKKQSAVVIEKTEGTTAAPHKIEAPAPVVVQEPSRETVKAAGSEPAKKPAVRTGQPIFSVLIGSFRNQSNAEAEVRRLSKLGYDARAVDVDLKAKGLWHRVLIGSYKSRSEALQKTDEIRRKTGKKDASVIVAE